MYGLIRGNVRQLSAENELNPVDAQFASRACSPYTVHDTQNKLTGVLYPMPHPQKIEGTKKNLFLTLTAMRYSTAATEAWISRVRGNTRNALAELNVKSANNEDIAGWCIPSRRNIRTWLSI